MFSQLCKINKKKQKKTKHIKNDREKMKKERENKTIKKSLIFQLINFNPFHIHSLALFFKFRQFDEVKQQQQQQQNESKKNNNKIVIIIVYFHLPSENIKQTL